MFADILRNVLTRVGGSLRNGRCCCSRTLAQFVTTLLPITCLISPARAIVFSSSMAGVAGKKGQGGCHEQYRNGMISSSFPHIAGCLRAGVVGTRSTCPYLVCRRRNSLLCRLKRTSSSAGISRWLVAHFVLPCIRRQERPGCQDVPLPRRPGKKLLLPPGDRLSGEPIVICRSSFLPDKPLRACRVHGPGLGRGLCATEPPLPPGRPAFVKGVPKTLLAAPGSSGRQRLSSSLRPPWPSSMARVVGASASIRGHAAKMCSERPGRHPPRRPLLGSKWRRIKLFASIGHSLPTVVA